MFTVLAIATWLAGFALAVFNFRFIARGLFVFSLVLLERGGIVDLGGIISFILAAIVFAVVSEFISYVVLLIFMKKKQIDG